MEQIVAKALEKVPEKRFQTIEELHGALFDICIEPDEHLVHDTESATTRPAIRSSSRQLKAAMLITVAAVMLAIALFYLLNAGVNHNQVVDHRIPSNDMILSPEVTSPVDRDSINDKQDGKKNTEPHPIVTPERYDRYWSEATDAHMKRISTKTPSKKKETPLDLGDLLRISD